MWLALLFLLHWPWAVWHEVNTRHEVCAEHGERIEIGSCVEYGQPAVEEDGEDCAQVAPEVPPGTSGHDHCAFGDLAQPKCVHSVALPALLCRAFEGDETDGPGSAERDGQGLHRLAPKQSPPT
jgi:hypothetical protein